MAGSTAYLNQGGSRLNRCEIAGATSLVRTYDSCGLGAPRKVRAPLLSNRGEHSRNKSNMDKTEERLMEDHTVTLNEVDIH
jgi:hypothetical protein